MSFRARSLALLCAISWAAPALAEEPATAVTGSGEDILRPSRRFDLRTELSGAHSEAELMFTLRQDHSVQLANDWQLRLRVDAPFKTLRDEEDGQTEWNHLGLSDVLLHAVIVRTVGKDEGFGVGAQLIVPTAGRDELGKGKWRLRPTIGYRWGLPRITDDTFFQLLARYDFSFAGDDDRNDVRELQISPNLEVALPGKAYVSFFPSADIRYNFVRDEFFFPLDVEVGKEWRNFIFSVEGARALLKGDHPPYDWRVETRFGVRF